MADYKKMCSIMFGAFTDAERLLERAGSLLQEAQQKCEELYIEAEDTPLTLFRRPPD